MNRRFPILKWLPGYGKQDLAGDVPAGLTVGVMLVPQGMAYALVAGLPVEYGLYAALVPPVIYALLGTSRSLAVGPVAMDSLLVASGLAGMALVGSERYIELALLLAMMMGLIQFTLGAFRMGFLADFLSRPVISGFTSAAALVIGLNQLTNLLGIPIVRSAKLHELLSSIWSEILGLDLPTLGISGFSILTLLVLRRIDSRIPGTLVVVLLGTLAAASGLVATQTVGTLPSGLPHFHPPNLALEDIQDLFPIAATLALISFMEAFGVAKSIAQKRRDHEVDANQELRAIGAANAIGSFFGAYPTTGGFSRTAVNERAGAQTPFSGLIAAGVVALALTFLTPFFQHLPKAVLGAIIVVAVSGLLDVGYFRKLWAAHRDEAVLLAITFFLTAFAGMVTGIVCGVAFSLVLTLRRTSRPHAAELGQIGNVYRNLNRFPSAQKTPGELILRYDGPLNYASQSHFKDFVLNRIDIREIEGDSIQRIVLSAKSIPYLDASATAMLEDLITGFENKGIALHWAGTIGPVRDELKKSGLMDRIGRHHFHAEVAHAMGETSDDGQDIATQSFGLETD